MVIRKFHPLKFWIAIAVVLVVLSVATPIAVSLWYTTTTIQHECTALMYLKVHPTHSAIFNHDIDVWAKSDGCR
jgi:hypothetical protein